MRLTLKEKKKAAAILAPRYQKARKKDKGTMLQEFVSLTGYRRSYASYVLSRHGKRMKIAGGNTGTRILPILSMENTPSIAGKPSTYTRRWRCGGSRFFSNLRDQSNSCSNMEKPQPYTFCPVSSLIPCLAGTSFIAIQRQE